MMKENRYAFLLLLLMVAAVFPMQAQEDRPPITQENLDQLQPLFTFPCPDENYHVSGASFSGENFVYECNEGPAVFTIQSLSQNQTLWQYETEEWARDLILLEGGDLVLADMQGRLDLIRTADNTIMAQADAVLHAPVAVSPDLQRAAFVQGEIESELNTVVVYSLPDFIPLDVGFPLVGNPQVAALALSNVEQNHIAIGESDGRIRVLNVDTADMVMEVANTPLTSGFANEGYHNLTFSPDGTQLLVSECAGIQMGCLEEGITRIDIASGKITQEATFSGFEFAFKFVGLSPETSLLLVTSCNQAHFLDVETLEVFDTNIDTGDVCDYMNAAFNEDGSLIAVFDQSQNAFVVYGVPGEQSSHSRG